MACQQCADSGFVEPAPRRSGVPAIRRPGDFVQDTTRIAGTPDRRGAGSYGNPYDQFINVNLWFRNNSFHPISPL
jgi:hypothetical protein